MLTSFFIIITLSSLALFYYGTGRDKRVLFSSLLWLLVVGGIACTGYFENTATKPPRFLMVLLGAVVLSIYYYKILKGNKISIRYLVAVHILRVPIELMLYQLFLQKQVPIIMTFSGWNFDIAIGISAILVFMYLLLTKKTLHRYFILCWNITGLLFLTTIVVIAILSSPLPIQQLSFDQPNIALIKFPFIYLPACIVPVVYLSHILMMRSGQTVEGSDTTGAE